MAKKTFIIKNKLNEKLIDDYIEYYNAKKPIASKHTIRSYRQTLIKLADFLEKNTKHKSLKNASEEEMIQFFNNPKYVPNGSHNIIGILIIPFYRWIENIDKHSRPKNMKWFETTSKRTKLKNNDPHRKDELFLTPEDYEKIIQNSNDNYNQWKAIWETYYLSGFRPEELLSMNIEDVREDKDHIVFIACPKSKTYPREIPLPEYPYNLMKFIGNHPLRNNKKAPLWFITKGVTKLQRLNIPSLEYTFRKLRTDLNLKPTLNIKCFRKTRSTILFNSDDPKINNDTFIGKYIGWSPSTVIFRRQEYNLTNTDDLKKALCKKPVIPKNFDMINKDLTELENKYIPKIKEQSEFIKDLQKRLKDTEEIRDTNRIELSNFKDDMSKFKTEMINNNNKLINKMSELYNKQLFWTSHLNDVIRIMRKEKKYYEENKISEDEFIKRYKNRVDELYNKSPKLINLKTIEDIDNVKSEKIDPILEDIKKSLRNEKNKPLRKAVKR